MKKIITLIACLFTSVLLLADEDIEDRLRYMDCIVPVKTDASVTKRIETMLKGRRDTEKMIGRSVVYFPIFDQMLKELELPADLKFITCLETELNNKTVSTSGAKGIWQLMTDVREEFGLRIDNVLDERLDLIKGTEAALKDLKRLYKAYGDWELALAGYNCGVGRLGQALKKARSKNFNDVKQFLPQQTQDYVPKFIAFTYIMKNYKAHNLKPILPSLDLQIIGSVKVKNYLSLSTVANITGLSYDFVKDLNIQYKEEYIPDNKHGYTVIVPRRVMGALQDYIANLESPKPEQMTFTPSVIDENLPKLDNEPNYFETTYYVGETETIESIADVFNISVLNIMTWNDLDYPAVSKGFEMKLFLPRVVPKRVANSTTETASTK
jgi:membrane-bound lytic murein transglycosylase D